jgi:gas vesicle protein
MRRQNDMPYVVIERRSGGLGGFILGALVGAAAALLYAPRSGDETRAELREGVRRMRDRAGDTVREMQDSVGETLGTVRSSVNEQIEHARDAFEAGRQSARDARGDMEKRARDTRERIRAGIDAARKPVEPAVEAPGPAEAGSDVGL